MLTINQANIATFVITAKLLVTKRFLIVEILSQKLNYVKNFFYENSICIKRNQNKFLNE